MEKQDLSKILIEDSEYYISNAPYAAFLKRHNMKTIDQIINGNFRNCSFDGHKMHAHTASSLRVFIGLLRHKYFGEPLLVDAYLDKTIDLEKSAAWGDENDRIFITESIGPTDFIKLFSFFGSSRGIIAYNRFIAKMNSQNKADKLLHNEVKIIDFFIWASTDENEDRFFDSFAKTYIEAYKQNTEVKEENSDTIKYLKSEIEKLLKMKDDIEGQILELQQKVDELSDIQSKGGIGL